MLLDGALSATCGEREPYRGVSDGRGRLLAWRALQRVQEEVKTSTALPAYSPKRCAISTWPSHPLFGRVPTTCPSASLCPTHDSYLRIRQDAPAARTGRAAPCAPWPAVPAAPPPHTASQRCPAQQGQERARVGRVCVAGQMKCAAFCTLLRPNLISPQMLTVGSRSQHPINQHTLWLAAMMTACYSIILPCFQERWCCSSQVLRGAFFST